MISFFHHEFIHPPPSSSLQSHLQTMTTFLPSFIPHSLSFLLSFRLESSFPPSSLHSHLGSSWPEGNFTSSSFSWVLSETVEKKGRKKTQKSSATTTIHLFQSVSQTNSTWNKQHQHHPHLLLSSLLLSFFHFHLYLSLSFIFTFIVTIKRSHLLSFKGVKHSSLSLLLFSVKFSNQKHVPHQFDSKLKENSFFSFPFPFDPFSDLTLSIIIFTIIIFIPHSWNMIRLHPRRQLLLFLIVVVSIDKLWGE